MTHLRPQIAISNKSFLLATKVIWSGIAWKYSHPAERMKNCNETRDVLGDSRRRYRVRGQRWEDPDRTNNQSERRIRYRPLREKYKYMLFTSREVRIGRNCALCLECRPRPTYSGGTQDVGHSDLTECVIHFHQWLVYEEHLCSVS